MSEQPEKAHTLLCRKRRLLEDSDDDHSNQKGKLGSDREQSASGGSGGESGSDFSGEESVSSEDTGSDVADSEEEEEEVKVPTKQQKQARPFYFIILRDVPGTACGLQDIPEGLYCGLDSACGLRTAE